MNHRDTRWIGKSAISNAQRGLFMLRSQHPLAFYSLVTVQDPTKIPAAFCQILKNTGFMRIGKDDQFFIPQTVRRDIAQNIFGCDLCIQIRAENDRIAKFSCIHNHRNGDSTNGSKALIVATQNMFLRLHERIPNKIRRLVDLCWQAKLFEGPGHRWDNDLIEMGFIQNNGGDPVHRLVRMVLPRFMRFERGCQGKPRFRNAFYVPTLQSMRDIRRQVMFSHR